MSDEGDGVLRPPGVVGFESFYAADAAVVPTRFRDAHALQSMVTDIRSTLDKYRPSDPVWKPRLEAVKKLRGLIAAGAASYPSFASLAATLRDSLSKQVLDDRSTLVKYACVAIAELSAALSQQFEPCVDAVFDALLRVVYKTNIVIRTAACDCARSILWNSVMGFPRLVPRLSGATCSSLREPKPKELRSHAAQFLDLVLRFWPVSSFDRHVDHIEAALRGGLIDADPVVRESSRMLYWSFHVHFPLRAQAVLDKVDPTVVELVLGDESRAVAGPELPALTPLSTPSAAPATAPATTTADRSASKPRVASGRSRPPSSVSSSGSSATAPAAAAPSSSGASGSLYGPARVKRHGSSSSSSSGGGGGGGAAATAVASGSSAAFGDDATGSDGPRRRPKPTGSSGPLRGASRATGPSRAAASTAARDASPPRAMKGPRRVMAGPQRVARGAGSGGSSGSGAPTGAGPASGGGGGGGASRVPAAAADKEDYGRVAGMFPVSRGPPSPSGSLSTAGAGGGSDADASVRSLLPLTNNSDWRQRVQALEAAAGAIANRSRRAEITSSIDHLSRALAARMDADPNHKVVQAALHATLALANGYPVQLRPHADAVLAAVMGLMSSTSANGEVAARAKELVATMASSYDVAELVAATVKVLSATDKTAVKVGCLMTLTQLLPRCSSQPFRPPQRLKALLRYLHPLLPHRLMHSRVLDILTALYAMDSRDLLAAINASAVSIQPAIVAALQDAVPDARTQLAAHQRDTNPSAASSSGSGAASRRHRRASHEPSAAATAAATAATRGSDAAQRPHTVDTGSRRLARSGAAAPPPPLPPAAAPLNGVATSPSAALHSPVKGVEAGPTAFAVSPGAAAGAPPASPVTAAPGPLAAGGAGNGGGSQRTASPSATSPPATGAPARVPLSEVTGPVASEADLYRLAHDLTSPAAAAAHRRSALHALGRFSTLGAPAVWSHAAQDVFRAVLATMTTSDRDVCEAALAVTRRLVRHQGTLLIRKDPVAFMTALLGACVNCARVCSRELYHSVEKTVAEAVEAVRPDATLQVLLRLCADAGLDGGGLQLLVRAVSFACRRLDSPTLQRSLSGLLPRLYAAIGNSAPDIRKAVVFAFVDLHKALDADSFASCAAGLTAVQQRLVAMYIEREAGVCSKPRVTAA